MPLTDIDKTLDGLKDDYRNDIERIFYNFEKELEALNQKTIYRSAVLPLAVVSTKPFTS